MNNIMNVFNHMMNTKYDSGSKTLVLVHLKIIPDNISQSKMQSILWTHHFSWGTNVRGFRGSPLPTNSHPQEHVFLL
jgi:hypothetical protein